MPEEEVSEVLEAIAAVEARSRPGPSPAQRRHHLPRRRPGPERGLAGAVSGKQFAHARKLAGLTQRQAARLLEISPSLVVRIEGDYAPCRHAYYLALVGLRAMGYRASKGRHTRGARRR